MATHRRAKPDRGPLASVVLVVSLLAAPAGAAELHVAADGSGLYATIDAAIDASEAGDEIVLGDGIFQGESNRDLEMPDHAITLRSESGDPSLTVVHCGGSSGDTHFSLHPFPAADHALILDGTSVTGSHGQNGLATGLAPLSIRRCWFYGNTSLDEGIIVGGGNVSIEESLIVGNVASAGAVVVSAPSSVAVTASTIAHNDGFELVLAVPSRPQPLGRHARCPRPRVRRDPGARGELVGPQIPAQRGAVAGPDPRGASPDRNPAPLAGFRPRW